jgi:hypothetical protein
MHIRRTYLSAMTDQLKTIPNFANRVWNQRVLTKKHYPCALIYGVSETVEAASLSIPRTQERTLTFSVAIYIRAAHHTAELIEQESDTYTALVEATIQCPTGATDLQLIGTEFPVIIYEEDNEDKIIAAEIVMAYNLSYDTTEFNPT